MEPHDVGTGSHYQPGMPVFFPQCNTSQFKYNPYHGQTQFIPAATYQSQSCNLNQPSFYPDQHISAINVPSYPQMHPHQSQVHHIQYVGQQLFSKPVPWTTPPPLPPPPDRKSPIANYPWSTAVTPPSPTEYCFTQKRNSPIQIPSVPLPARLKLLGDLHSQDSHFNTTASSVFFPSMPTPQSVSFRQAASQHGIIIESPPKTDVPSSTVQTNTYSAVTGSCSSQFTSQYHRGVEHSSIDKLEHSSCSPETFPYAMQSDGFQKMQLKKAVKDSSAKEIYLKEGNITIQYSDIKSDKFEKPEENQITQLQVNSENDDKVTSSLKNLQNENQISLTFVASEGEDLNYCNQTTQDSAVYDTCEEFFDDSVDEIEEHEFLSFNVVSSPFYINGKYCDSDEETEIDDDDKDVTSTCDEVDSAADDSKGIVISTKQDTNRQDDTNLGCSRSKTENVIGRYKQQLEESQKAQLLLLEYVTETAIDIKALASEIVKEAVAKGVLKFVDHSILTTESTVTQYENIEIKSQNGCENGVELPADKENEVFQTIDEKTNNMSDEEPLERKRLYSWTYRASESNNVSLSKESEEENNNNNIESSVCPLETGVKEKKNEIIIKPSIRQEEDFEKFFFKQKAFQYGITIKSPHTTSVIQKVSDKVDNDFDEDQNNCNDNTDHYEHMFKANAAQHGIQIGKSVSKHLNSSQSECSDTDSVSKVCKYNERENKDWNRSQSEDSDVYSVDGSQSDTVESFKLKALSHGITIQDPKEYIELSTESDVELEYITSHKGISSALDYPRGTSTPDPIEATLNAKLPEFKSEWRSKQDSKHILRVNAPTFNPDLWNLSSTGSDISILDTSMRVDVPEFKPEQNKSGNQIRTDAPVFEPKPIKNPEQSKKPKIFYPPTPNERKSNPSIGIQVSPILSECCVGTRKIKMKDFSIGTSNCDKQDVAVNTNESGSKQNREFHIKHTNVQLISKCINTDVPGQRSVGVSVHLLEPSIIKTQVEGVTDGNLEVINRNTRDHINKPKSEEVARLVEQIKKLQIELSDYKVKEAMEMLDDQVREQQQKMASVLNMFGAGDEGTLLDNLVQKVQNKLQSLKETKVKVQEMKQTTISQIQSGWMFNKLPNFLAICNPLTDTPSKDEIPNLRSSLQQIHSHKPVCDTKTVKSSSIGITSVNKNVNMNCSNHMTDPVTTSENLSPIHVESHLTSVAGSPLVYKKSYAGSIAFQSQKITNQDTAVDDSTQASTRELQGLPSERHVLYFKEDTLQTEARRTSRGLMDIEDSDSDCEPAQDVTKTMTKPDIAIESCTTSTSSLPQLEDFKAVVGDMKKLIPEKMMSEYSDVGTKVSYSKDRHVETDIEFSQIDLTKLGGKSTREIIPIELIDSDCDDVIIIGEEEIVVISDSEEAINVKAGTEIELVSVNSTDDLPIIIDDSVCEGKEGGSEITEEVYLASSLSMGAPAASTADTNNMLEELNIDSEEIFFSPSPKSMPFLKNITTEESKDITMENETSAMKDALHAKLPNPDPTMMALNPLTMMAGLDPMLLQAVIAQLIQAYPEMVANQEMLTTTAIQQTRLLQYYISTGQSEGSDLITGVNTAGVMGAGNIPGIHGSVDQITGVNAAGVSGVGNIPRIQGCVDPSMLRMEIQPTVVSEIVPTMSSVVDTDVTMSLTTFPADARRIATNSVTGAIISTSGSSVNTSTSGVSLNIPYLMSIDTSKSSISSQAKMGPPVRAATERKGLSAECIKTSKPDLKINKPPGLSSLDVDFELKEAAVNMKTTGFNPLPEQLTFMRTSVSSNIPATALPTSNKQFPGFHTRNESIIPGCENGSGSGSKSNKSDFVKSNSFISKPTSLPSALPGKVTHVPLSSALPEKVTHMPLSSALPEKVTQMPLSSALPEKVTHVPLSSALPGKVTHVPLSSALPGKVSCENSSSKHSSSSNIRSNGSVNTARKNQYTSLHESLHHSKSSKNQADFLPDFAKRHKPEMLGTRVTHSFIKRVDDQVARSLANSDIVNFTRKTPSSPNNAAGGDRPVNNKQYAWPSVANQGSQPKIENQGKKSKVAGSSARRIDWTEPRLGPSGRLPPCSAKNVSNQRPYSQSQNLPPRLQKENQTENWEEEVDHYAKPFVLDAVNKRDITSWLCGQKNESVDETNPCLTKTKPATICVNNNKPVSKAGDISDIPLQKRFKLTADDNDKENKVEQKAEEEWCQVQTKKKRHTSKEQARKELHKFAAPLVNSAAQGMKLKKTSNFERLVIRMQEEFPSTDRQTLVDAVTRIREIRGSLSGLSMENILEKARSIITTKHKNKVPDIWPARKLPPQTLNLPPRMTTTASAACGSKDEDICVICHDPLTIEPTMVLDCGHNFHTKCIAKWVEQERTCPTCRKHALFSEEFPRLGK